MLFANFTLATTDRQKDQQGNWQDKVEWHNLVAARRTAEIVRDYVKKGTKLYIEGKIQTRSWDDKESGQKKYKTEIFITSLILLGDPNYNGGQTANNTQKGQPTASTVPQSDEYDFGDVEITDDDLPPF